MDIFKVTILAFSLVLITLYILFFEQLNSYFLSLIMLRGIEMIPTKCPDYWKETKRFYHESGWTNGHTNDDTTQIACHVTNGVDALPVNSGRCNYVARPDGKGYYDKSSIYGIPNYCDMSYNNLNGAWSESYGYPDRFVIGWRDFFPNPPFIHKAIISIMPNNYYTATGLIPNGHNTSRISTIKCASSWTNCTNNQANIQGLDSLKVYRIGLWELEKNAQQSGGDTFLYIKSDIGLDSTKAFSYTGRTNENTHTSADYDDSSILINNYDYSYIGANTTHIYDQSKAFSGELDEYIGTGPAEAVTNSSRYYKSLHPCNTSINSINYTCPTTFRAETNKLSRDTYYLFVYLMDVPEHINTSANYYFTSFNQIKQPIISIKDHLTNEAILHEQGTLIDDKVFVYDSDWDISTWTSAKTDPDSNSVDTALSYFMHKWDMDSSALGIDGDFTKTTFNQAISNSSGLQANIMNKTIMGYVIFKTEKYSPLDTSINTSYNQTRAGYPVSTFDKMSSCQKYLWAKEHHIEWHGITNNPLMKACNKYSYQQAGKVYVGSVYDAGNRTASDLVSEIQAVDAGITTADAESAANEIISQAQNYSEGQFVMNALGLN
tara:strand:+ start:397 stop:2211 length:1815 start_codon:yes stop_codon:yes gene_type:complete